MTLLERLSKADKGGPVTAPPPREPVRLPEWRRRALEAHRRHGWVAEKEVAA